MASKAGSTPAGALVPVADLRIGLYIELDLGWMAHPFPTSSFKISTEKQIETLRGLGLKELRYLPEKSDPPVSVEPRPADGVNADAGPGEAAGAPPPERSRSEQLRLQQRELAACERRMTDTIRQYRQVLDQVNKQPLQARDQCAALIDGFVGELLGNGESAIRLLSDGMGDKLSMHPVNVSVLSLLLGKYMGLAAPEMSELGLAAFLHDIGKAQVPDRVRWADDSFSSAENKAYQEHVAQGVLIGQRMQLAAGVLQAIAQHHELVDGSGFPGRIKGDAMSRSAKIVALVNRYDDLCNPSRPANALTPHEALALIFAQMKTRFDATVLGAFIRMMGVYPPGSVVQLNDERFAMVVSVNSSRPLKPRVIVFEPRVPKNEALILDLEREPALGIRRSLKPMTLPRSAMDYLSPRQRISYFFERAVDAAESERAQ